MLSLFLVVVAVMATAAAVRAVVRMRDRDRRPDAAALWAGVLKSATKGIRRPDERR